MSRDEVDRRVGAASTGYAPVAEVIGRPRQPRGQVAEIASAASRGDRPGLGQPEAAHGVAEMVVPVGGRSREPPRVPAVRPQIPRLVDELDGAQQRVGDHGHVEGVAGVEVLAVAAERDGQVEPESVDADLADPVAQRVEGHPDDGGAPEVERVPAARGVHEDRRVLLIRHVVGRLVESAPGDRGAVEAPLARVVVHDVEDDLQPRLVQGLNHGLHLVDHGERAGFLRRARRIARLRREVRQGVVPPVVRQALVHQEGLGHLRVNGQELDGGHPQGRQVAGHRRVTEPRVRAAQLGGHVGVEGRLWVS